MQVPSPVPMPTWKHPWLRFYNVAKFHEWRAWFLACPLKIWIQTLQDWMHCPEFWGLRLFIFLNTMPGRLWFLDVFCIFFVSAALQWVMEMFVGLPLVQFHVVCNMVLRAHGFPLASQRKYSLVLSEHIMHVAQFYKRCDFIGSWKGANYSLFEILLSHALSMPRSILHSMRCTTLKHHKWSKHNSAEWSIWNPGNNKIKQSDRACSWCAQGFASRAHLRGRGDHWHSLSRIRWGDCQGPPESKSNLNGSQVKPSHRNLRRFIESPWNLLIVTYCIFQDSIDL